MGETEKDRHIVCEQGGCYYCSCGFETRVQAEAQRHRQDQWMVSVIDSLTAQRDEAQAEVARMRSTIPDGPCPPLPLHRWPWSWLDWLALHSPWAGHWETWLITHDPHWFFTLAVARAEIDDAKLIPAEEVMAMLEDDPPEPKRAATVGRSGAEASK